jgi:hypothetical protein
MQQQEVPSLESAFESTWALPGALAGETYQYCQL